MLVVACPNCGAKYRIAEHVFDGRARVSARCRTCRTAFMINAPAPLPPRRVAEALETPPPSTAPAAAKTGVAPPADAASADTAPPGVAATVLAHVGANLHLPQDMVVALSVTEGRLKGTLFRLSKPRVVVGRFGVDIVLDDPEVSRRHCVVEVQGPSALLIDLDSANGTFVNDQRVERRLLEHLSEFRIGGTTLMLTVTRK